MNNIKTKLHLYYKNKEKKNYKIGPIAQLGGAFD